MKMTKENVAEMTTLLITKYIMATDMQMFAKHSYTELKADIKSAVTDAIEWGIFTGEVQSLSQRIETDELNRKLNNELNNINNN